MLISFINRKKHILKTLLMKKINPAAKPDFLFLWLTEALIKPGSDPNEKLLSE